MSDLAKAFAGLKQAQKPERPGTHSLGTQAPKRASTKPAPRLGPRLAPPPLQEAAKNSHPDYKAVKVFLRKDTHKAAGRKWEDEERGDFSDLVEMLLEKYVEA